MRERCRELHLLGHERAPEDRVRPRRAARPRHALHVAQPRGHGRRHGHSHRREWHHRARRELPLERPDHRDRTERRHSLPRRRQPAGVRRRDRERAQPACGREPRDRGRRRTDHSIQQRGPWRRSERAEASARDDPELDRPVREVSTGSWNSGKRARTSPRARIPGWTTSWPDAGTTPGRPGPGSKRSTVWGTGVRNPLNVVGGKILAPPTGRALYYIANREKGV